MQELLEEEERTVRQLQDDLAAARSDALALLDRPPPAHAGTAAASGAVAGQAPEDAPLSGRQARVLRQRMEYLEAQNKRLKVTWVAGRPTSALRSGANTF